MPKRKRSTAWYREVHKETESILNTIFTPTPSLHEKRQISDQVDESIIDKMGSSLSDSDSSSSSSLSCANVEILGDNSSDHFLSCRQSSIPNDSLKEVLAPNGHNSLNTVEKLKKWAVENKVTLSAINQLLAILVESKPDDFHILPRDARTFLSTPKLTITRKVDPGEYYHFGIQKSLEDLFKKHCRKPTDPIQIGINIDGLPIAKSSNSQFYPILGLESKDVFLIGLYHGYEKPKNFNQFLSDFIEEAIQLTNNGVELFGQIYNFKITKFLFDAVAKASILAIKGHAGYSSCTKCAQHGESIQDRVCFPLLTFEKRTHESFVQQSDDGHHSGHSMLLDIPNIDIIADVPLDYMHLVLLGVVKKLLCGLWCYGPPPHKFSSIMFTRISELLMSMIPFIPSNFARMPRSLKEVKRWKATEFRQFLLYTGPVVLMNILPKKKYQHFLILSISIRILLSEKLLSIYLDYAEKLLICFVKSTKHIYGSHLLTHNFHNLLHLVDDVRKFGVLDNFSNFESENFLQYLRKLVRKNDKPLQQVVRRYYESIKSGKEVHGSEKLSDFHLVKPHCDGPLTSGCSGPEFKSVVFPEFKLSCTPRDSSCALKDGTIIEIENFAFSLEFNEYIVIGKEYMKKCDFFDYPLSSSTLNIFCVHTLSETKFWPLKYISHKLVRIPYGNTFTVFPLIHAHKHLN